MAVTLKDIKSRVPDFASSTSYLDADDGEQTDEETKLTEYSIFGPSSNEKTLFYGFDDAGHHFRVLKQASPDILLVHQSKLVGFYLKLQSRDEIDPISRELKNFFLLDVNMKV